MNTTELTQLICNMETKGGSFVSAIGTALRYADPANRKRLLDAFPDLVQKYGPNGMFAIAQSMAQDLITNKS